MEKQLLPFHLEYREKVRQVFEHGGTLFFIERTDTNEFFYEDPFQSFSSRKIHIPDKGISWTNQIDFMTLSQAYLTREDAEKYSPELSVGGCRYCKHGSTPIPIQITEHEFIKQQKL